MIWWDSLTKRSSPLPHLRHHHFSTPLVVFNNATLPNLHHHQHYFAWSFIIIIVPPSSLSLSIGIIFHHDFGEDWFWSLSITVPVGVTTTHFPDGDQIVACLHSIFILVHILLNFPLTSIDFDHSPLLPVGVTTAHFLGGDCIGFSLPFLSCFGSTLTIYPLMIEEVESIASPALLHSSPVVVPVWGLHMVAYTRPCSCIRWGPHMVAHVRRCSNLQSRPHMVAHARRCSSL